MGSQTSGNVGQQSLRRDRLKELFRIGIEFIEMRKAAGMSATDNELRVHLSNYCIEQWELSENSRRDYVKITFYKLAPELEAVRMTTESTRGPMELLSVPRQVGLT